MAKMTHSLLASLSWLVKTIAWYFATVQLEWIETTDSYQSYVNLPSVRPKHVRCGLVCAWDTDTWTEPRSHLITTNHSEDQKESERRMISCPVTGPWKEQKHVAQGRKVWVSFIFPHQGQTMYMDRGFHQGLYMWNYLRPWCSTKCLFQMCCAA